MINVQKAPYPEALAQLVATVSYKPGWGVTLEDRERGQGSVGLTLTIFTDTVDSYHAERRRAVAHLFVVPAAAYDERSWRRWLFDRYLDVEQHECAEFFQIDGVKPYAPSHGPGNDPYMIREVGTVEDVRTSFRGEVNP